MVRDDVLRALEQHRGKIISGGMLAKKLNVSRTAVWKAVTSLRKSGFPIESIAGGGYCLSELSDALSEAGFLMGLKTEHMAHNVCILPTVNSTNTYLKERAAELPDGYTVIADSQSAGRGRLGRSFASPTGSGLYISILLHPTISLEQVNMITIGAAVAVSEAVMETAGFTPDIKWVNDVLKNGKKLCGILTEASVEAETGQLSYAVVGVGINVRRPEGGMPEEIQEIAGCLEDFAPHSVRRNALAASFCNHMESCYQMIVSGNTEQLLDRYRSFIRFLGEPITVIRNGEKQPAVAAAIDADGHLVIEQNGQRRVMLAGEISIRLPEQASLKE